jgi:hypothetical protein
MTLERLGGRIDRALSALSPLVRSRGSLAKPPDASPAAHGLTDCLLYTVPFSSTNFSAQVQNHKRFPPSKLLPHPPFTSLHQNPLRRKHVFKRRDDRQPEEGQVGA